MTDAMAEIGRLATERDALRERAERAEAQVAALRLLLGIFHGDKRFRARHRYYTAVLADTAAAAAQHDAAVRRAAMERCAQIAEYYAENDCPRAYCPCPHHKDARLEVAAAIRAEMEKETP